MFDRVIKIKIPEIGFETTGLKIVFNIEKSLVGYPNLANIKIYNLSSSTRNLIKDNDVRIELYAGYVDTETTLAFSGEVVNVVHRKDSVDWISEIFAKDGNRALNNSTINKTFSAGATIPQITDELIAGLEGVTKGIVTGLQECLNDKRSLLRSWQLSGSIRSIFDTLAERCGFEWSINDSVFEAAIKNLPFNDVPPLLINQQTGMIGSPERTEVGINVKVLLTPSLKLGRVIRIKSVTEKINIGNTFFRPIPPVKEEGVYRVDKMVHAGDNWSSLWETMINARVFS